MSGRLITRAATALALALALFYAGYLIVDLYRGVDRYQWDFGTYYSAAKAFRLGLDPYDTKSLERVVPQEMLPFVYPPVAVALFGPFTALPYDQAARLWLSIKLICLAGMLFLWWRYLFRETRALPAVLYLLLAFGGALYLDLRTGNVSIPEQCALWAGIIFLLRDRPWRFCACVLLSSLVKLTPVLFLLLLPLLQGRRGVRPLAVGIGAFVLLQALQFIWRPTDYSHFLSAAGALQETGRNGNLSIYALLNDLAATVGGWMAWEVPAALVSIGYLAAVSAVFWIGYRKWRRVERLASAESSLDTICLFCCTYALTLPRFKTYSFILLLPVGYHVLRKCRTWSAEGFLLVLMLLAVPVVRTSPPPSDRLFDLLWTYYPLGLALVCWAVLLSTGRGNRWPGPEQARGSHA